MAIFAYVIDSEYEQNEQIRPLKTTPKSRENSENADVR